MFTTEGGTGYGSTKSEPPKYSLSEKDPTNFQCRCHDIRVSFKKIRFFQFSDGESQSFIPRAEKPRSYSELLISIDESLKKLEENDHYPKYRILLNLFHLLVVKYGWCV